ncbi:EGF-like and EMI domain-containing protein 1 [Apteryx mantelli]|uniref:EGF-like and EMI domain-containing protein 1 n=1 Tax=Apteryx mantelli TaxID=2696672 RepID=A0ABM4FR04_9AVES
MELHMLALSFTVALRISSLASGNQLQPHMPNVCAEQELAIVGHRQPCVQAFTRVVKVWKQACGGQLWCAGYERRTAYHTAYRQVYALTRQTAYRCCPGWAPRAGAAGCLHRLLEPETPPEAGDLCTLSLQPALSFSEKTSARGSGRVGL